MRKQEVFSLVLWVGLVGVATADVAISTSEGLKVVAVSVIGEDEVMQYDLRGEYRLRMTDRCTMANGSVVALSYPGANMIDGVITVTDKDGSSATITPQPQANISGKVGGVGYPIACDDDLPRFYYAHPVLGFVAAFGSDRTEVWRRQLAPFTPLAGNQEYDLDQIREALLKDRSNVSTIVANGSYLLVVERTGERGFTSHIFESDGREVGTVGPGDAVFYKTVPMGFRFVAGGGTDMRFYTPRQSFVVMPSKEWSLLLDHTIAWLTPLPYMRTLSLDYLCPVVPLDQIKRQMGARYDESFARQSRALVLTHSGTPWLKEFLGREPLPEIAKRFNPTSSEWVKDYREGLLAAGFDEVLSQWMAASSKVLQQTTDEGKTERGPSEGVQRE